MPEVASTLATWRIGGQIDESALTGLTQFADIIVTATLVGADGQNAVDPTNEAHVLRGPYVTVMGGTAGTVTANPAPDASTTLAGRLWWTEPLKPTGAALPADALQPSGLGWSIVVETRSRRGATHTLATFLVGLEGDRDYTTAGETILVPSGTGGVDEPAVSILDLTTPPATVVDNTFSGRVLDVLADNGIDGTPELPVGGTTGQALTKASGTNYDVTWSTIVGGGGGLPFDWIDGSDFLDGSKYDLWNGTNGHASMTAADSTADFQALFDHAAVVAAEGTALNHDRGGVHILLPRGRFLNLGTVTIPDMVNLTGRSMFVDATGVEITYKAQGAAGPMFRTGVPTDNNDAEFLNDRRNMWTWRGGHYDGDKLPGEIAFEWNAVSRMVMERISIQNFETAIRGRFVLHFKLRDSIIHNCSKYGLYIGVSGSSNGWPGATPGNAASNGTVIENVRFYGATSQTAQVLIEHCSHIIRDCTFEGGGPADTSEGGGYNIWYRNTNTSALTASAENVWLENTPAAGHFKVDTVHQYKLDIQHATTNSVPIANVLKCTLLRVERVPYSFMSGVVSTPVFKLDDGDVSTSLGASNVNMHFTASGRAGGVDLSSAIFAGGVYPRNVIAIGLDGDHINTIQTKRSSHIMKLTPPNATGSTVGTALAATWVVTKETITAGGTVAATLVPAASSASGTVA